MAGAITERTRLRLRLQPEQPDRRGRSAVPSSSEFLDRCRPTCWSSSTRPTASSCVDADVPDGLDVYRDRPNVCVLRTFSKAYGLAGLRVGFAIAHEPVAVALRKTAVPFGV